MTRNEELWENALRVIPGGVNSPVRAFRAVGGSPPFLARGQGCRVYDADGKEYVDHVASWGPLIAGHAHPRVVEAIARAAAGGTTFGAPTEGEVLLANSVSRLVPSCEKVRLVSSGTEATMTAVRLARGVTGRDRIVKFAGCYHGHADSFLIRAGSGATTLGIPDSPGVPRALAELTLVARYNDLASVRALFGAHPDGIAAVIVEPVAGNMGCVLPAPGFLAGLRELSDRYGALLVFDEVITGFRLALGGAQAVYAVRPDLTTLGKILGGGLPLAAVGGKRSLMDQLAPEGKVYQAGTLSGNPVAVAAALATLGLLEEKNPYRDLEERTKSLAKGLEDAAVKAGIPVIVNRAGSMFTVFFTKGKVTDYESALQSDTRAYARFFHALLANGVYFPPAQFEVAFVGMAHDAAAIDRTLDAAAKTFAAARG
ncbi:MAG: glutamate-1-semialdehyde 2,1-aminomutase [Planctomycetes bacterium]|nr:glutamate-1-semialdehyde 2,1-aminomutase [Planctomycetota bacterium]